MPDFGTQIGSAIIALSLSGCASMDNATELKSADVWNDDRVHVYPSHDVDAGVPDDDLGSHFATRN